MNAETKDYSLAHVLLTFLSKFMEEKSPYKVVGIELVLDGSMRFRLEHRGKPLTLLWSEHPRNALSEVEFQWGVVGPERIPLRTARTELGEVKRAGTHVAARLTRLMRGKPPHILQWRNRNPQRIIWGRRLFNNLCPDLLVKGQTRYFDYLVSDLNEYEGFINVKFQSRQAAVILRLVVSEGNEEVRAKALISWGPISLVVLEDKRTGEQRGDSEHRVEDFLGYLLSRNLPPKFSLRFECDDPPAGYLPPDRGIDFIRTKRLDDSSFFEMLFATAENIGVVSSCDRECFNLFSLVSSPKENWTTIAPWQMLPASSYLRHCYHVSLTSQTTVMGGELTERCLDRLAQSRNPPDLIIYFDSCLHRLIGEDIQGKLQTYRRNHSVPLVYYDIRTTQHPYLQQMIDFWRELYREVCRKELAPDSARVCFLGIEPRVDPLVCRTFDRLGVKVGGHIFPQLVLDEMKEIRQNSLVVANCWEYVRIMFSDMLKELDRPAVRLPLPYGVDGTTRWIDAVHLELRQEPAALEDIPEVAKAREQFREECGYFRGQRVGIVARALGVKNRLSPSLRFGVPLIGFLHELGLGIDLNLFVHPDEEAPVEGEVAGWLGLEPGRGDSVGFFRSQEQLGGILENGDFSMVYTETFRDRRITGAGKSPLMLRQLSPGYTGAVDTARRIRGILQSSFHRRYRAFFPSAYSHWEKGSRGSNR